MNSVRVKDSKKSIGAAFYIKKKKEDAKANASEST
jgi:hypothetical protein